MELLILADGWKQGRDWDERLRMAMVAAGFDVGDVFADVLPPEDVDPADDVDRDLDYSPVDWAQDVSPDDWELLQTQLDSSRVTVSDSAAETPPENPGVPDVDFDREWQ
ncbi:hypothetical protein ACFQ6C_26140 [Streptomyces sp. NPDC056454]|uniref:hypothetical protein n=1 Tax=Streptomyces sp. NPDC056454 TaxID=3345823 RepID=UPI003684AE3E